MDKKQFRALQATWRLRLKASGFKDAEDEKGRLKEYHSKHFSKNKREHHFTQRYYELASQLLHTFPFLDLKSKHLWELHSLGWDNEDIAEELGISVRTVARAIEYVSGHIKFTNHEAE